MKSVGVLITWQDNNGDDRYGVINPEHPYIMLTPEETPADMLPIIKSLVDDGKMTPLGVLVDPEIKTA